MPELPEVESVRRSLLPKVIDKIITSVDCMRPEIIILRSPEFKSADALVGCSIKSIERGGKYLLWHLEKPREKKQDEQPKNQVHNQTPNNSQALTLAMHLRMTGRCLFVDAREIRPKENHTHITLSLANPVTNEDIGEIRWQDVRRFGRWELFSTVDYANWDKGPKQLGKEPFDPSCDAQYLQQFSKRHDKLKLAQVLLDQRCIAGLGNIYVQELLYQQRLSPLCPAWALTKKDWERLIDGMRLMLAEAIEKRGTSFSDYVDANGHLGNYQEQLKVYGRIGLPCFSCGKPLQASILSGRRMAFCQACQKLKRGKKTKRV